MSRQRAAFALAFIVVAIGSALRFAYLDADPDYYAWAGYITDEGRWVAHARDVALFGRIVNTDWLLHLHLFLAPLFQAISVVTFELLGVSIWAARLPSALAGSLVLVLFWLLLRRVATPAGLLVGLFLIALDVDLIELSRLAVPEMTAMLAQLAVYAVIVTRRPTTRRMLAAGLLLACAVAIKATVLPTAIIFSAIILFQPIEDSHNAGRLRHLLMLWAGLLSPLPLLLLLAATCCHAHALAVVANVGLLGPFLELTKAYGAASFFFTGIFAPTLNIWMVGFCFSLAAWLLRPRAEIDPALRRHFVSSAIWSGFYLPIMLSLDYFPERYKVHVLVPLAINIAAGVSLATVGGRAPASPTEARPSTARRLIVLALAAVPAAAVWAPALAGIALRMGVDATRFRIQLVCVLVAGILTAWSARRFSSVSRPPLMLFVFPIAAIIGWMVCVRVDLDAGRFWPVPGGNSVAWWTAGLPITAAATTGLVAISRQWTRERWLRLVPAAALCYAVLGVARIAPAYVAPTFTIAQASRSLGRSLASATGLIATANAEGLFNDNTLPYRAIVGRTWPPYRPEFLVTVFVFNDPQGLLGSEYCLAASYPLYTSPEAARPALLRVYRRRMP
jgi:hypothetical protein